MEASRSDVRISLLNFPEYLSEPIDRAIGEGERVVLERRGRDVAAVVSVEDLRRLEALEDAADVKAAHKARKEKGGVPLEKVAAELGLAGRRSKLSRQARTNSRSADRRTR